ncbi:MAG: sigma-54-dependent Fis family transcriptional regulator [Verrucomicrobia bacterium]|jgi:DNA-binding NtrC family response regulator|nr:sigma-54-dependent Fis family transcriptional regulator [Verrucomicrobiota bacterium]
MATNTQRSAFRVVIIDDDPTVLLAATGVLGSLGLEATTFQNPVDALQHIRETGVDIVVSDIYMPDHDGFTVLKELKTNAPGCDVILVTARGDMETAVRALREGATDFVTKPLTAASLRAAFERTRRFHSLSEEKRVLESEVDALKTRIQELTRAESTLLGDSQAMEEVRAQATRVAQVDVTALITGESGTGKELAARFIHEGSPRNEGPFVPVNCASIPAELFESEMFGHRRGAFTGAVDEAKGFVSAAEGGTLFLDEIGDLPAGSQAKILRLLEQRTYTRVGDPTEQQADVRIVAATNQDLVAQVEQNRFRQDLYYRLAVCHIHMPPLRDHKADIPTLALYFALQAASSMGREIERVSTETMQRLLDYGFPGNIRELRNIMERSVIFADHTEELLPEHLPPLEKPPPPSPEGEEPPTVKSDLNMESVERQLYVEALKRTENNVSAAARVLGISRGKLRRRLAALDGQQDA